MEVLGSRMSIKMHFYDPISIIFQTIVVILEKNKENASTKIFLHMKIGIQEDGMLTCFITIVGF